MILLGMLEKLPFYVRVRRLFGLSPICWIRCILALVNKELSGVHCNGLVDVVPRYLLVDAKGGKMVQSEQENISLAKTARPLQPQKMFFWALAMIAVGGPVIECPSASPLAHPWTHRKVYGYPRDTSLSLVAGREGG